MCTVSASHLHGGTIFFTSHLLRAELWEPGAHYSSQSRDWLFCHHRTGFPSYLHTVYTFYICGTQTDTVFESPHIPCLWEAFPDTLEPCSGLPSVTACISPLSFCCCCSHYLSSCCAISSKAAHPGSILLTILSVEHEKTFHCKEGGRESHSGFGVLDPSWLCQEGPHYIALASPCFNHTSLSLESTAP